VPQYDNGMWTVMSYDATSSQLDIGHQATPMPLDILAIQEIYGANLSYRTGDDLYLLADDNVVKTIWDAGGVDTISAAQLGGGVAVDLHEGSFIHSGSYSTTAIAFNVTIENAVGSAGSDTLIGNAANNVLDGAVGADRLEGGLGDDTYLVDSAGDFVVESAGAGMDTIRSTIGLILSADVENLLLLGAAASGTGNVLDNMIVGNAVANKLDGGLGDDTLDGGLGGDSLVGGAGDDVYLVDAASDKLSEAAGGGTDTIETPFTATLAANFENLTLTGLAAVNATGNAVGNILVGNGAGNILNGAAGADTMVGGVGNDVYIVENIADVIEESPAEGFDVVQSSVTFALADGVEDLTLTGASGVGAAGNDLANKLLGNSAANQLSGAKGADTLDGGAGNDSMAGGKDDDLYKVNAAGDIVTEVDSEGIDTVQSSVSYALASAVENLTLIGAGSIAATGNASANALTGNGGANALNGGGGDDTLDGGAGADLLTGGAGDDLYIVGAATDKVVEAPGGGVDTVFSSIGFALGADVENLVLTGKAAINGAGNALANSLIGNVADNQLNGVAGADSMAGGGGNDLYLVDDPNDLVSEDASAGTDAVQSTASYALAANVENLALMGAVAVSATGNDLANLVTGNAIANEILGAGGNDTLNGGIGGDTLVGGLGDDLMVVDDLGDAVVEGFAAGVDTVQSTVSLALAANVENLKLMGSAAISGAGNALDNQITGNGGANLLLGDAGNDTLDGGAGADKMTGGAGDDVYVVNIAGDVVIEDIGQGTDRIVSTVTVALGANVEGLTLTGAAAANGTGNALDNEIIGNSAANALAGGDGDDTLIGGGGADNLSGGAGDDRYVVDNVGDKATETAGAGNDSVQSSVSYTLAANIETLQLAGSAAINGTGNAGNNLLIGNAGNNILNGMAGADTMAGGMGNDAYVVDDASDAVSEAVDAGTDILLSAVTIALGDNIEQLTLTGAAAIDGSGNALANQITGNTAANKLAGGEGVDTLNGGAGNDSLAGGDGDDLYVVDAVGDVVIETPGGGIDRVQSSVGFALGATLEHLALMGTAAIAGGGNDLANQIVGNSGANTLTGGLGNDTLDGAAGADSLVGGADNDLYVVDNIGDKVVEDVAAGIDVVQSSVAFTLGANVEHLILTGKAAIAGTGNALDNEITGNAANNALTGGDGNDTLTGGAGADNMTGGAGDDLYVVDNVGDKVNEAAGPGIDSVESSVTFTLGANLTLTVPTAPTRCRVARAMTSTSSTISTTRSPRIQAPAPIQCRSHSAICSGAILRT
jgi:Ca2+-binding RTX toxin-like protein